MASTTNVISIGTLNVEAGSGYKAMLLYSFGQPAADITRVQRDANSSVVTNITPGTSEYLLQINIETADADTMDARRRALMRALDSSRGPATLVIENAAGTARRRYMNIVVSKPDQIPGHVGDSFNATIQPTDEVRWRAVTATEHVLALTTSPTTAAVTVSGDLDVYPVYAFTPTSAKTTPNWPYSIWFVAEWPSSTGGMHILDVTGGGLNTAALVSGGYVADGSNMAVRFGGRIVKHWYGHSSAAFGTTTTKMWINADMPPYTFAWLEAGVDDTASVWRVSDDAKLPPSGALKIDNEIITYASRWPGLLYGVQRGMYGTTAAVHYPGVPLELVHVGHILYGPSASTPLDMQDWDYRNALPPVIDRQVSTNSKWVYNLNFSDPPCYGSWQREAWQSSNPFYVSGSNAAGNYSDVIEYPWYALGLKPGWASSARYFARFALPIKRVRVDGRRRALASPTTYPGSARLTAISTHPVASTLLWDSAVGATRDNDTFSVTPADLSRSVLTQTPNYTELSFGFSGANYMQADIQYMEVTFCDDALPIVTHGSQESVYDLVMTVENTTTGESIAINRQNMALNKPLIIDSDKQTAIDSADGSNQYTAVVRDAPRAKWLRLVPGTNNLKFTEAGLVGLTVTIRFEERWYT